MQEKNLRYRSFSIRLNEDTIEELKAEQKKSNKSWNLFMFDLIKKYVSLQKMPRKCVEISERTRNSG